MMDSPEGASWDCKYWQDSLVVEIACVWVGDPDVNHIARAQTRAAGAGTVTVSSEPERP
jgi:hypothetical protein